MKTVYFVNAHPDDLVACLGLCMRLSADPRFAVRIVDVTHGERGLAAKGVSLEECARIRQKEEETVCGAMGLTPQWLGEVDGEACASSEACKALVALFAKEPPDVIITQWPVDRHADHMVCATIALNALRLASGVIGGQMMTVKTEVYFYAYASNSIGFVPTHYFPLDDTAMDRKSALISNYACQEPDYITSRDRMEAACHGLKVRAPYAEAYESFQPRTPGEQCFFDLL